MIGYIGATVSDSAKQQLARLVRLWAFMVIPALFDLYHKQSLTRTAIIGVAVSAAEVVWRQLFPVAPVRPPEDEL